MKFSIQFANVGQPATVEAPDRRQAAHRAAAAARRAAASAASAASRRLGLGLGGSRLGRLGRIRRSSGGSSPSSDAVQEVRRLPGEGERRLRPKIQKCSTLLQVVALLSSSRHERPAGPAAGGALVVSGPGARPDSLRSLAVEAILPWVVLVVVVIVLLEIDLHWFARGREPTFREGVIWSIGWLVVSLLAGGRRLRCSRAPTDAVEYTTVYLIERSLSLDNLFVFILLFAYFGIPSEYRARLLFWGIIAALVLRLAGDRRRHRAAQPVPLRHLPPGGGAVRARGADLPRGRARTSTRTRT